MFRMFGRCRWVPHNFNPSDAMTKIKGAHLQPCLDVLASGMYHLKTEAANLADRAAAKGKRERRLETKISTNLPINRRCESTNQTEVSGSSIFADSFSSFFRPYRTRGILVDAVRPVGVVPNTFRGHAELDLCPGELLIHSQSMCDVCDLISYEETLHSKEKDCGRSSMKPTPQKSEI